MITGATLLAAGGAFAQSADSGTTVGEVVVTGSRIPHPNLTTASPVTTVTSSQIKLQGAVNVEDFINNLPQVFADQGQYLSNGSTGTAAIDLRGLTPERTLVLIDGKRLMPGDATDPVADINFIPPALIDHVDVLTGGASAVYGSDAIAGVVNFVMKKNFTGLQIDAETSVFESSSNNSQTRTANNFGHNSFGLPNLNLPSKDEWDGQRDTVTITGGANSPDDKGNVEFYFGKTTILPVNEGKRDYSACTLATNNTNTHQQYCGGSSTSNTVLFQPTSGANSGTKYAVSTTTGLVGAFGPGDDYNYAPSNYFQRPDTRYTAGEFSTYNINPHINIYSSFMFLDDHTVAAEAPSGSFNGDNSYTVPCNDPLLSTAEQTALCGAAGVGGPGTGAGSATTETANIAHRNVEGGPRISDIEHTDYRIVFGAKGEIMDGWSYDASAQYGHTVLTDIESGYFLNSKLKNALDVIPNPAGTGNVAGVAVGAPVCAAASTGVDTKCVPYNIFGSYPGGITPAALAYLNGVAQSSGTTTEQVYSINITGDLGKYGMKSPFATKAAGINFGFEYRDENLTTSYDAAIQGGDLAGSGGSTLPTSGSQADKDVFGELSIPLIEDMPFAKSVTFDAGYRYSDYTSGGGNSSYKFELDWQTTPDFMLRGSYERAVRAPNVQELFLPASPGLVGGTDPCAGALNGAGLTSGGLNAAQCYNTFSHSQPGITFANFQTNIFGHIDQCPAAQCGAFSGGNPALKPESADTFTYGAVFTPTFFHGFSLTVDYFNIDVKQAIVTMPFETLLNNCAKLDNAYDCSNIDRYSGTNYGVYGGEGLGEADLQLLNASSLKTSGVDVEAVYRMRLSDFGVGDWGSLVFDFNGTYLHDLITVLPDGTQYNCAGLYGVTCGTPSPKWRHTFSLSWNTPWNLTLEAKWRYYGSSSLDFNTSQPDLQNGFKDLQSTDANIPSYSYLDLAFSYKFKDRYTIHGGVNNVLDKSPPLLDSNSFGISAPPFGNGNTYPQVYDPLGRMLFLGLTADF